MSTFATASDERDRCDGDRCISLQESAERLISDIALPKQYPQPRTGYTQEHAVCCNRSPTSPTSCANHIDSRAN